MNKEAEKIDPMLEKKKIKFWGESIGGNFNKKRMSREEKEELKRLQEIR
jgi:hypothetical protein